VQTEIQVNILESMVDYTRLLTVQEAARYLGLTVSCLRAWILKRRIASVRLGRAVRIPYSEIERLIEEGYVPARPERGTR
jgi:excisionase family DNA binding protein